MFLGEYNIWRFTLRKGMRYESWSTKQNGVKYENWPHDGEYLKHLNIMKHIENYVDKRKGIVVVCIIAFPDK